MKEQQTMVARDRVIVRTSAIGIVVNVLLAGFKALVGLISGSIAIVLDAVNNLSDALSSVITIIGAKIATRKPDKKHPLGHGRVEYVTASVISIIVLYAGLTSMIESVKKIIHPEVAEYTTWGLIIIAVAVVAKLILGTFVKRVGKAVKSDSLIASGKDAFFDAIISSATLAAAILYMTLHVSLEAWLGAIISIVIIKAGIDMLRETISKIIGERADPELTKQIKQTIASSVPEVMGVYDLFLHDYGPERKLASCHVEVPDTMKANEIDVMTRKVQEVVFTKHHVIMEAVGIYSYNTNGDLAEKARDEVMDLLCEEQYVLQMHGFYMNMEEKKISFDVIIDFAAPDRKAVQEKILNEVKRRYPDYDVRVILDLDISD